MARIESIEHRLNNWGYWKDRESRGGLGFYTQSAFLNERVSADRYRESNILATVDNVDAELINRAVESLRVPERVIYDTLQLKYVVRPSIGHRDIGRRTGGVTEAAVVLRLGRADALIQRWLMARDDMRVLHEASAPVGRA